MKELLEYIVKALVDHPDEVFVSVDKHPSETVLELSVAGSDMGRVIGKNGKVINSIRDLIKIAAAKEGVQVSVEILETGRGR